MKKLYCVPNCKACDEIKEWIKEQNIKIEMIELVKLEGEWHEQNEDGFLKFDKSVHSFPALFVENDDNNKNAFLIGKEGIQSIILKNYIYEQKTCPHLNSTCIEKECGKFVIINKGPIQEGNCSDYWTSILLIEMLTKGK